MRGGGLRVGMLSALAALLAGGHVGATVTNPRRREDGPTLPMAPLAPPFSAGRNLIGPGVRNYHKGAYGRTYPWGTVPGSVRRKRARDAVNVLRTARGQRP